VAHVLRISVVIVDASRVCSADCSTPLVHGNAVEVLPLAQSVEVEDDLLVVDPLCLEGARFAQALVAALSVFSLA